MTSLPGNKPPALTAAHRQLITFIRWLVEPLATVDEIQRRHLRLLSAFLLFGAISIFSGLWIVEEVEGRPLVLASGIVLLAGYGLSRTRYHSVGKFIAISVPVVPIVTNILLSREPEQIAVLLPWLSLPLLICILLLSLRGAVIVAAMYVLLISGITLPMGLFVTNTAESLALMFLMVILVIAITATRQGDQHEIERQLREREQAESALKESEKKFSSAFMTSPNAICIVSVAEGNFIDVNESFSRFTGYATEEIIGHSLFDLALWVKEEELNQMATQLQENGKVASQEFQSRTKSGEIRVGLYSAEIINIQGKPCVSLNITDITEYKRHERLQQEENQILMLMCHGAELNEILDAMLRLVELYDPSIKGFVMLLDPANGLLVQAAGPILSDDFIKLTMNGLPFIEGNSSSKPVAYRKTRIVIPDMESSPFFQGEDIITVAKRNNMLSCWSQPIISSKRELLGTIVNYGSRVGEPDAENLEILEWSAQIATIAIERKRAEETLKKTEEKVQGFSCQF